MSLLDKPYPDVPGTTIFDAEQSRKGYHLNQFCMSLMKAENRERFKADERAYLDEWPMTEEQKQAVLARDLNRLHRARRQHLLPRQDRRHRRQELPADGRQHDRHDRRGVPRHDDRGRPLGRGQPLVGEDGNAQAHRQPQGAADQKALSMARITASVYTSHVPAIGAAHRPRQDRRAVLAAACSTATSSRKQWIDGATSPTSSSSSTTTTPPRSAWRSSRPSPSAAPAEFTAGRRRLGPAPGAQGDRPPGARLRTSRSRVIQRRLRPDHRQQDGRRPRPDRAAVADVRPARGLAVPGDPVRRQRRAVPGAVGQPLLQARPGDPQGGRVASTRTSNVQIWGTGGMSHQLQGPRAGLINKRVRQRASSTG